MRIAILQDNPEFLINTIWAGSPHNVDKDILRFISDVLIENGYSVKSLHVSSELERQLDESNPEFVFNLSSRQIGANGLAIGPYILEKMGIPFTGSSAKACTNAYNKGLSKKIFIGNDISTPDYQIFTSMDNLTISDAMSFPLFIKPVFGGRSRGLCKGNLIRDKENALAQIKNVIASYPGPYLMEEFITGREFSVGFLGNCENSIQFPILEYVFPAGDGGMRFRDHAMKEHHFRAQNRICPANLSEPLQKAISGIAARAVNALNCRDYARVDVRVDVAEKPFILEVNALPSLMPIRSSYVMMAAAAGIFSDKVVVDILRCAMDRNK